MRPLELIETKLSNAVRLICPFSVSMTTSVSFVLEVIGKTAAILLALLTLMSWVMAVPEAVLEADGIEYAGKECTWPSLSLLCIESHAT